MSKPFIQYMYFSTGQGVDAAGEAALYPASRFKGIKVKDQDYLELYFESLDDVNQEDIVTLGVKRGTGGKVINDISTMLRSGSVWNNIADLDSGVKASQHIFNCSITHAINVSTEQHITASFKWEALNLNPDAAAAADADTIWLLQGEGTNQGGEFSIEEQVDTLTSAKPVLKSSIFTAISSKTTKLIGGKLTHAGENGVSYKMAFYKVDVVSTATNKPYTKMAEFEIVLSVNNDAKIFDLTLQSEANRTLSANDVVMVGLQGLAESADLDTVGVVTLLFSQTV